jgi:hypothetical protein
VACFRGFLGNSLQKGKRLILHLFLQGFTKKLTAIYSKALYFSDKIYYNHKEFSNETIYT